MKKVKIIQEHYSFDELSDTAKQKAIDDYRNSMSEFAWSDESIHSLKEFCKVTRIVLRDYSLGLDRGNYIRWSYSLDNCALTDIKGLRLRTWLINNWLKHFQQGKSLKDKYRIVSNDDRRKLHPFFRNAAPYLLTSGNNKGMYMVHARSRINFEYDNCPLTGYAGDMSLIQPILDFIKSPDDRTDLEDMINRVMDNFESDFVSDMESQLEDDYIAENIRANEYTYDVNGNQW